MGVNIAKLVHKALKGQAKTVGMQPAMLIKATPGTRDPANLSGGTQPTATSYPCDAMIEVLTVDDIPATLVQQDDRKIGILGNSLPSGIVPGSADTITLADIDGATKTFRLVAAVTGDGVGALYEFQARK